MQHTRVPVQHTRDTADDSVHHHLDNKGNGEEHISNRNHDNDHSDKLYDRTTLLNIWKADWEMYMPLQCRDADLGSPLSKFFPFGFPTLINGRELDHPRYDGRYDKPTNNSDHSPKSDDLRSMNHKQLPQQEPRVTDSVCQGCYGASFRLRNYVLV